MLDNQGSRRDEAGNHTSDHRSPHVSTLILVAAVSLAVGAAGSFLVMRSGGKRSVAVASAASAHVSEPGAAGEQQQDHPPGTVYISPSRQQLIGVRTARVEPRELESTIRTVGTLAYDETRVTAIHTKISGWVERVWVDYVGKEVRAGEPLFTVYSPELVSTQTEYLLARRSKEELGASPVEATRQAADALLRAARQRLELWDIAEEHIRELEESGEVQRTLMLHSPFNGVVLERNAYPGQYLTPEMAAFRIADLSRIWAFGQVYEYELARIRTGQAAEIEFPYGQAARSLAGRITFIYPEIDPQTRRVRIRAEFDNPGLQLKPETFVTVLIRAGGGRRLAVPKEAVIDTGVKRYAILAHPGGYFEPREIQVGEPFDDYYPLLGGVAEGDEIVVSAQFLVDSETNLQSAMQAMMGMPGMGPAGSAEEPADPGSPATEAGHRHPG